MKICFPHNTAAMVGGVLTHFAAGVHDVGEDLAAVLLEDGDALPVAMTEAEAEAQAKADADAQAAAQAKADADADAQAKATKKK